MEDDELLDESTRLRGQRDHQMESVIQQLEQVIRIKEQSIDRLTIELSDARDQSAQLEGQKNKTLTKLKDDRIEELEEALRESVRITADREVALDAETQKVEAFSHFFFVYSEIASILTSSNCIGR